MALIECKDVSFSYDGKPVLEHVNFTLSSGDFLCIVGENGSGKSTLVRGLVGLKKPASGEIRTGEGFTLKQAGYLPQQTPVQRDFPASVEEVVLSGTLQTCGFPSFYRRRQKDLCEQQLRRFGMWEFRKKSYRDLSGGQQQRVLLARALCASQRLLVLDEPVTGLDPIASEEMYADIARAHRDGMTIIMITHDIQVALEYADHVLHIGQHELFFGTVDEYRNSANFLELSGGVRK